MLNFDFQIDKELETGEYFLSEKEKRAKKNAEKMVTFSIDDNIYKIKSL